jgi:hypothetical protein
MSHDLRVRGARQERSSPSASVIFEPDIHDRFPTFPVVQYARLWFRAMYDLLIGVFSSRPTP